VEHLDARAAQLAPERLAEGHDARLGSSVGRRGREPGVAADARVVHDRAAAALEHPRQDQLGQVHEPDEVDLEHRVDVVGLLLLEQAAGHEARVVHEQIDRGQLARRRLDRLAGREVHGDVARLARAAGRRRGGVGVRGAHSAQQQRERARRELLRYRAPDASARSGYEGCGSGEIHGC